MADESCLSWGEGGYFTAIYKKRTTGTQGGHLVNLPYLYLTEALNSFMPFTGIFYL